MSTQAPRQSTETEVSIPKDIDSARAKLVYVYLAVRGTASAEELSDQLDIGTGTALTITNTLRSRGHVKRTDGLFEIARD